MKETNNKKPSIVANYIYNMLYEVISLLVPIITTPYVSRVLSVDSIGVFSYTQSNTLYFTAFVALGTKSYAIKRISRMNSKDDISKTFWNVFSIRFLAGIISLVIYFSAIWGSSNNKVVTAIQSIYIFGAIADISWLYQGVENFKTIVIRNIFVKIITLLCIFGLIKNNNDFILYVWCMSGLTLLGNVTLWVRLPSLVNKPQITSLRPFEGIKEIIILFIPTLALQIYSAVDKTMLGSLTDSMTQSGYYEQASKITHILLTIITTLSVVTLPRISMLYSKNMHKEINEIMHKSYRFVLLISIPFVVGMNLVSSSFVPLFLGSDYYPCVSMLNVFSLLFIIVGFSNITGFQYLVATDRQLLYSISIVSGTIFNIIANCILIPKFEAIGAVIASVVSELLVLLIQVIYVMVIKKELHAYALLSSFIKYILSSCIMAICVILTKKIPTPTIVNLSTCIIVGIASYFTVLLLLKDSIVTGVFSIIIKKIKR